MGLHGKWIILNLQVLLLFTASPSYADKKNYYQRFDDKSCQGTVYDYKKKQVKKEYLPPLLDQGEYSTCYLHSSLYLLQYLYRLKNPSDRTSLISRIDLLTKSCKKNYAQGGNDYAVLQHFKTDWDRTVSNDADFLSYERFMKGVTQFEKDLEREAQDCRKLLRDIMDPALAKDMELILYQAMMKENKGDSSTMVSRWMGRVRKQKTLEIPPYNVHVSQPQDVSGALQEMHTLFSKEPPAPVILNFCDLEDEDGQCSEGFHSVAVTGVREVCCGIRNKDGSNCHDEWEVHNSYGKNPDANGWFKADSLAESMIQHKLHFTYARPCIPGSKKPAEACQDAIQGDPKRVPYYLTVSNDTKTLEGVLKKDPKLAQEFTPSGSTLLHVAIETDNLDALKLLVEKAEGRPPYLDPNQKSKAGLTPLQYAISRNQLGAVRILLENGADPSLLAPGSGQNGITQAIAEKRVDIAKTLIQASQKPLQHPSGGIWPTQMAVARGNLEILKLLAEKNYNLNLPDPGSKSTPLMVAASYGNQEITKFLLELGVNPLLKSADGRTARQIAEQEGQPDIAQLIASYESKFKPQMTPLIPKTKPVPALQQQEVVLPKPKPLLIPKTKPVPLKRPIPENVSTEAIEGVKKPN